MEFIYNCEIIEIKYNLSLGNYYLPSVPHVGESIFLNDKQTKYEVLEVIYIPKKELDTSKVFNLKLKVIKRFD